jgi:diguanylate cyclase (GGDEF)-like protein
MLSTARISVITVMNDRRRQLAFRLLVCFILTIDYGLLIGWPVIFGISGLYLILQWLEAKCFSGAKPWLRNWPRRAQTALAVLSANSVVFGAPTLWLTRELGSWGEAGSAYLLSGTILNAVLTTIGCRPAFRASAMPFFLYLCILPFIAGPRQEVTSPALVVSLAGGSIFLIYNVWALWTKWSLGRTAEITAARRYVAERNENERRLLKLTQQDGLTGLLNRNVLQARLAQMVEAGQPAALLMIDLDGFKYVNDTLGHSAGDTVLREIAGRIRDLEGLNGMTARLGGDEFALLLAGWQIPEAAMSMADMLIAEVCRPVDLEGKQINIGASIGIAMHPRDGLDAERIFANADLALYLAKTEGRHCARHYHPDLRMRAMGKVLRDSELQQALQHGEFEMFYQPQLRLSDGALTGAEALLRWRHAEHGVLRPGEFLAALEGGLLSAKVGAWVIETACRQAAIWRMNGQPDFRIAVNIFGAQFRSGDFVQWVVQACDKAGLPAEALEIEITENVMLRHEDDLIGPLKELRALGVGVVFDDYGTGFASLSMLTRFPVSRLKIDRSFTKEINGGGAETAVIRAMLGLARMLNLSVTAEGVETQAQADALVREGCPEAQGYFFGVPMPADEFSAAFLPQPRKLVI